MTPEEELAMTPRDMVFRGLERHKAFCDQLLPDGTAKERILKSLDNIMSWEPAISNEPLGPSV